jgi:hypothetical protein
VLEAICLQLVERGALDRELLISDLIQVQAAMVEQKKVGFLAFAVPGMILAALGWSPPAKGDS